MLRKMGASQFLEWQTFAELEPFDEERDDLRAGSIVAAIYNVNRTKKSPRAMTTFEAALKFGDTPSIAPKKTGWQQMKATAQMIAAAYSEAK